MSTVPFDRRSLLALLAGTSATLVTAMASAENNVPKDDSRFEAGSISGDGNIQLQAIGALGVGHIQSTLGLIGVIADSMSKDIYSQKQIEDLMNGTFNGLESPKRMLRRLQDTRVSGDDAEFLDRMISVFNALQREARALAVYAKSRKSDDAVQFEKHRRMALKKLGELTQQEAYVDPDSADRRGHVPNTSPTTDAND